MSGEFVRKKRWHPKARSGCLTCRKRRVKCDESKPCCQKCIKNDSLCEGSGYGYSYGSSHADSDSLQVFCSSTASDVVSQVKPGAVQDNSKLVDELQLRSLPVLHVLAGGRLDPFNAFCVDSSSYHDQYIFDHAIHSQWSLFAPSQRPDDLDMVKQNVMSYVIHNPVSYHALLYAGACHRKFWQKSVFRTTERDPELVQLKVRAIRALREAIREPENHEMEDVLVGTIVLAAHDGGDKARRRPPGKVQGRKPLVHMLDAEFYCELDVEWKHLNVFYHLLHRCGGILSLRPGAVQTAAVRFDIFNAFMHLTAPRIPALLPLIATLTMRSWPQDDTALLLAGILGHGFGGVFDLLPDCAESIRLQQVVQGFVNMTIDFDHVDRSRSKSFDEVDTSIPNESSVFRIRSMLIHELLTIPESLNTTNDAEDDFSRLTYEICRSSCLMFCQVWAFPDSNRGRRMARTQVHRLIPLLRRATAGEGTGKFCSNLPDFYTWVVVLGLMLAYEDFDVFSDATCIAEVVPFLAYSVIKPQPEAWPTVSTTLSRFLWLWKDCDINGKEAWNYACLLLSTNRE